MVSSKTIKYVSTFLEHILTLINIVIVLRLIILSVDLDYFRDPLTDKFTQTGNNLRFFQKLVEDITGPLVKPCENLLVSITNDPSTSSVLSYVFVISFSFLFIFIIKIIEHNIVSKEDSLNNA